MSWLELPGPPAGPPPHFGGLGKSFFESAAEGWGPFTFLTKKEERKSIKDRAKAGAIESQTAQQAAEAEARLEAVKALRAKINSRMAEANKIADETGQIVEQIRILANDDLLLGEPVLDQALADLDQLELLVVQIHANTVADTATNDTQLLAQSYSSAQAAASGMKVAKARALGVHTRLSERLKELEAEQMRLEDLKRQAEALAVQERLAEQEAQRALEEELREAQLDMDLEARAQAKRAEFEQVRKINKQIAAERAALDRLREELATEKRKQRDLAATRARLASLRSRASA